MLKWKDVGAEVDHLRYNMTKLVMSYLREESKVFSVGVGVSMKRKTNIDHLLRCEVEDRFL